MSDETPTPESWPMTPQEARDLALARANLAQVQAQFNAISGAFGKRVGLVDGAKVKYDLDKCEWRREG